MEGIHSQVADGLSCIRCHGDAPGHPRNKNLDLMYFGDIDRNEYCVRCHQPEVLSEADWTHDVHLDEIPCSSCHQLHPEVDPISGIGEKARTALCVDCHGNMSAEGSK
ncbi:hypothetical protein GCM10023333_30290 [Ferrimonas pelagia]|uniref:Cytochrome c-type protein NrfB-like domain-containing protein n=2 Tax=Ferrimonas pelagia TaxID=1177826 RepID=A0ABP9F9I7_9GAMM